MNTNNKWLVGAGVILLLVVMFALPFLWHTFSPVSGYGMMGGYSGHGSMMSGGSPMYGGMMSGYSGLGFFGMGLMWLIPLALLIFLCLSIAALIKYLRAP